MKKNIALLLFLSIVFMASSAFAGQINIFVSDFSVIGVQGKEEIKQVLKTMIASRLNSGRIAVNGNALEAEIVVNGTYIVIGKIFSLDAIARDKAGSILARVVVQGEGQDELIPAISSLVDKLSAELNKVSSVDRSNAQPKSIEQGK